MASNEQVLNSPGYIDREIDKSQPTSTGPIGTPAGLIGTANKGPAFVPVVVGNFGEFQNAFGDVDIYKPGTYAAKEWLNNKTSLTYLRVLGAGSDVENQTTGETPNAGFYLSPVAAPSDGLGRHVGAVQLLAQQGNLDSREAYGYPMFTDNDSYAGSTVDVVRGVVLLASGARMMVLNGNASAIGAFTTTGPYDLAVVSNGIFKLAISSSLGAAFSTVDGNAGVAIYSASFNPDDQNYFGKILNRDPRQFAARQHLLYADYAVDAEILSASYAAVLSGSSYTSENSGDTARSFLNAFGTFKSRYKTAKTPSFISQPFGKKEFDLFSFEALDDGEYANTQVKISITNVLASLDPSNKFGSFTVQVRAFNDTDANQRVLETYPNCTLNPNDDHYIAKLIGDKKVFYNLDVSDDSEKRVVTTGKYQNVSKYVRVQVSDLVDRMLVPAQSLPFGFRGMELLKTNDLLADTVNFDTQMLDDLGEDMIDDQNNAMFSSGQTTPRLAGVLNTLGQQSGLTGSIVPPIPMRFKVTRGEAESSPAFIGAPGPTEIVNPNYYWGVKFERNDKPTNPNLSTQQNPLISAFSKMMGIRGLDMLVTGSGADGFNSNKFTLARVALSNDTVNDLTSSVSDHMREAAYLRDADVNPTDYSVIDKTTSRKRVTLASILQSGGSAVFNRFSHFAKYTTFMQGGFDGVNALDSDAARMNDKASSFDTSGGAEQNYVSPGLLYNMNGVGQSNGIVNSYRRAIDIMTDKMNVNINILAIPGVRDSFVTDYASQKVREYGFAYYIMDIPSYDDDQNRLYDGSQARPSVVQTTNVFDGRAIDNNYVGTYFPDVVIDDQKNNRRVKVPASVAAMTALGFNDRVAYPWFAPAGFNRAALDNVKNAAVRLNTSDRNRLNDSRINPIATFPRMGFVIYGQKTLQVANTSLNRVNVRRLLLEVKRIIVAIANTLVFEQNTQAVRSAFVKQANEQLGLIAIQSGIDEFNVRMDDSNNTPEDAALNKLNGRIVIVPTKSFETIAIDFIITSSGVQFGQ